MKRRITIEQLQELTQEQQEKLREWWLPEYGDWYLRVTPKGVIDSAPFLFNLGDFQLINYKEFKMPLMDIGQMIQLLEPHYKQNEAHGCFVWKLLNGHHQVFVDKTNKPCKKELCDALWEAIKEAL